MNGKSPGVMHDSRNGVWGFAVGLALACSAPGALAHLLPDGQATVNVQGRQAFVALSLPLAWLGDIDDDRDGHLSAAELKTHRSAILQRVNRGIAVDNGGSRRALQDVLLSPSPAHERRDGAGTHLLVMGSAPLADASAPVRLDLRLSGPAAPLRVTATRDPLRETAAVQGPVGSGLFFAAGPRPSADRAGAPRSSASSPPPGR